MLINKNKLILIICVVAEIKKSLKSPLWSELKKRRKKKDFIFIICVLIISYKVMNMKEYHYLDNWGKLWKV